MNVKLHVCCAQYEKIEVTRSGPEGCEAIPEMDNFLKLKSVLPKFLGDNLTDGGE